MDLVNLRRMRDEASASRLAEQLGELADLRDEGKLDLIGVCNVDRARLEQALELTDIAEVQNPFSILDRTDEDVLELCIERDARVRAVLPARLGVHRRAGEARRRPGDRGGRREARRHPDAGRARLAARAATSGSC